MTLAERLSEMVRACFTGVWIESHEHQDALADIAGLCRQENWRLATWDLDRGLNVAGIEAGQPDAPGGSDPLAAIRSLGAMANGRCLSANEPGIYQRTTGAAVKPTRKVRRDPQQN